jgi:ADP-heptose:LPS heptosyltransferase
MLKNKKINRILISRTDKLGDVVLTLPVIGYLKTKLPNLELGFYAKLILNR